MAWKELGERREAESSIWRVKSSSRFFSSDMAAVVVELESVEERGERW
jgi:hypothetical protein